MQRIVLLLTLSIVLAACGTPTTPQGSNGSVGAPSSSTETTDIAPAITDVAPAATSTAQRTPVSIGMGYIPDVQFAPFYVAQAKGYYADEGLDVTFVHGSVQDKLIQTAQGQLTFVNASGDEVLLARSQGIPITRVFQLEQQSPVAIFAKQETGITKPEDLRGKIIGVPGRFGATYYGLLGVLKNAGLSENDVTIAEVGFTQAPVVREDKVQAAVGYANNEPLLLQREGVPVNVLRVGDYFELAGNGIVASVRTISQDPDLVRRFVRATARGLQDTIANPDEAFTIALEFVPELGADQQPRELQKLKETVALWQPKDVANGLGYADPQQWQTTYRFLRDSGLLQSDVEVEQAFRNDLRPE